MWYTLFDCIKFVDQHSKQTEMTQYVASDAEDYGQELTNKELEQRLLSILRQSTTKKTAYCGQKFEGGYHTWKLPSTSGGTRTVKGQRDCVRRLKALVKVGNYSLRDKVVLDIGCNQGGCLVEIGDQIKFGIGVDVNPELINCANRMASHFHKRNLTFYTYDVDAQNGDFDTMLTFLPYKKPNIIFLLAVCQWIVNWKSLITWCYHNSLHLLFEDNGNKQQQKEHQHLLDQLYGAENVVDLRCRENGRVLLLCSKMKKSL